MVLHLMGHRRNHEKESYNVGNVRTDPFTYYVPLFV